MAAGLKMGLAAIAKMRAKRKAEQEAKANVNDKKTIVFNKPKKVKAKPRVQKDVRRAGLKPR